MPIPLRKLVKILKYDIKEMICHYEIICHFYLHLVFSTCSIWREYLMTRRGRFQMPSGRLTFPIHNLCDQNRQKSIKKVRILKFCEILKKILEKIFKKRKFWTEKRPQAVGGGNLDSGHEATIESLLGLVVIDFFRATRNFGTFFTRWRW